MTGTWLCNEPAGWRIYFVNLSGHSSIFLYFNLYIGVCCHGYLPKLLFCTHLAQLVQQKHGKHFKPRDIWRQLLMLNICMNWQKGKKSVIHPANHTQFELLRLACHFMEGYSGISFLLQYHCPGTASCRVLETFWRYLYRPKPSCIVSHVASTKRML